jgi:hypothetical protein
MSAAINLWLTIAASFNIAAADVKESTVYFTKN